MLDLLFAAGQAASVLLLLYGGGLVVFSVVVAPFGVHHGEAVGIVAHASDSRHDFPRA